jgi:YD repeat-containing protein
VGKAITPTQFFQVFNYTFLPSRKVDDGFECKSITRVACSPGGSFSDNPFSSFNGIGYDKVTKRIISGDNKFTGRVEQYYNNTPDISAPYQAVLELPRNNLYVHKNSQNPANGNLKKTVYYNDIGKKVKEEEYQYKNIESSIYYGVNITGYTPHIFKSDDMLIMYNRHLLGYYPIFDFESLLVNKKEKQYIGNDSIINEETYAYDNYRQINQKCRIKDSKGYNNNWYYKYPYGYTTNTVYKEMVERNQLTPVIEQYEINYKGNTVNFQRTNYRISNNIYLPDYIESKRDYSASYDIDITFNQYDTNGNIIQYTEKDGIPMVYLWSYSGQYPIAEIKNAAFTEIEAAAKTTFSVTSADALSALTTPDEAKLKDGSLQRALPNALVTTYTYKPLVGMLTATDPSGVTTYYEYDDFGRLKETYIYKDNIIAPANKQAVQKYDYHYRNQ